MTETLSSDPKKTRKPRVPKQERSQARLEAILDTSLQLIAANGYEAVSMREIARETSLPIASLYMYFPTKLSIAKEVWLRYTTAINASLEEVLKTVSDPTTPADSGALIEHLIDLMVGIQSSHPGFVEIWGCVAASAELRELNREDTFRAAQVLATTFRVSNPSLDATQAEGLALLLTEGATAVTKLILTLPEEERPARIRQLKDSLRLIHSSTVGSLTQPAG